MSQLYIDAFGNWHSFRATRGRQGDRYNRTLRDGTPVAYVGEDVTIGHSCLVLALIKARIRHACWVAGLSEDCPLEIVYDRLVDMEHPFQHEVRVMLGC